MPLPKVGYQDYIILAHNKNLIFLHNPDELPDSRTTPALWQCRLTGEIFKRSYHNVMHDDYPSPGQKFAADHLPKYWERAAQLGIEFLFNPELDKAPSDSRQPMKWRGRNGNVVIAGYDELTYRPITHKLMTALGLTEEVNAHFK